MLLLSATKIVISCPTTISCAVDDRDSLDDLEVAGCDISIEDAFIQKELSQKALICLHELEDPYKEVFMLSVFGGFSLKDICSIFGKSESWARVTFYRAKQKLSERMR